MLPDGRWTVARDDSRRTVTRIFTVRDRRIRQMRPYIVSCLALLTVGCTTFADLGQREPTRTGSMPGSARPLAACAVDAMEARNSFFHSGIYSLRDIEHGARVRVAAQSSVPMLEATLVDTQGTVTVET